MFWAFSASDNGRKQLDEWLLKVASNARLLVFITYIVKTASGAETAHSLDCFWGEKGNKAPRSGELSAGQHSSSFRPFLCPLQWFSPITGEAYKRGQLKLQWGI